MPGLFYYRNFLYLLVHLLNLTKTGEFILLLLLTYFGISVICYFPGLNDSGKLIIILYL